jgi:pimeloyl-ACP methyl ester carboxylesterase
MVDKFMRNNLLSYLDEGKGPALVLLHAFPLSRLMWQPQVEVFRQSYRVVAPDLRGFGGSLGFEGPPSVERMADDVALLLDELKLSQVVLAGLSMGGYVALAFVRRHAARVRGLVLADTKAEPDDAAARANRDRLIALAAEQPASALVEQLVPKLLGETSRARRLDVADEVRRIAGLQAPAGVIGALKALRDRPDAGPGLAAIGAPTLVVVGVEDVLTPPDVARGLSERIPGARLVAIEAAGHLSNLENSTRFNEALRTFLAVLP